MTLPIPSSINSNLVHNSIANTVKPCNDKLIKQIDAQIKELRLRIDTAHRDIVETEAGNIDPSMGPYSWSLIERTLPLIEALEKEKAQLQ